MPEIVAELSCNHLGSLDYAKQLIHVCARAGAEAVKFQAWTPDTMVLGQAYHQRWGFLYQLYRDAWTPWEWFPELAKECERLTLPWFSSVFDADALKMLEDVGCCRYKIASFELTDLPLIEAVAATHKPMILSCGMATLEEIAEAVRAARQSPHITLLRCVSAYPTRCADAHLATMVDMRQGFQTAVGLSDHSQGHAVSVAAAALGADMIERHVTLSRADGGPDAEWSLEPAELAELVNLCAQASEAIGKVSYGPLPGEAPELRRSLWITQDMTADERFTPSNLGTARPAEGLSPRFYRQVLARRAAVDIKAPAALSWEMVQTDGTPTQAA